MRSAVWMNGRQVDPASAVVSIFDRGFLMGEAVYEVLRADAKGVFARDLHLDRFEHSLSRLGMSPAAPRAVWEAELALAHAATQNPSSLLRMMQTRGRTGIGLQGGAIEDPQRIVIAAPFVPPDAALYTEGARLLTRPEARGDLDPSLKSTQRQHVLIEKAGAEAAHEVLRIGPEGEIKEGTSSNFFLVLNAVILTAPLSAGLLRGVTRELVFELAPKLDLTLVEARFDSSALAKASEAFITSTSRGIMPVSWIDDAPIGSGRPGPITQRLSEAFESLSR